MKAEVDVDELLTLKNKISQLQNDTNYLRAELAKLKPDELKKEAQRLAVTLANKYVNSICLKLGFSPHYGAIIIDRHVPMSEWTNSEKYELKIGATMMKEFKTAFIEILTID